MPRMNTTHASCVVFEGAGLLLRGPSGAGKSDLALRLIDGGAELVADDQVLFSPRAGRLFAAAPERLAGLIEVRGVGIVRRPYRREAVIDLVVDLVSPAEIARMPEPRQIELGGISLPAVDVAAFETSTIAKLRVLAQLHAPAPSLVLIA